MDAGKIAFITCVNNEEEYAEALYYIGQLRIPEGYVVDSIAVREAESMALGYQAAMESSDARYKVYLHQDTFLVNRDFISDMLAVFTKDEGIGMLGCIGCEELPLHAQAVSSWNVGRVDNNGFPARMIHRQSENFEPIEVEALDGLLLATQQDVAWRSSLFDGFDFYDISQCLEMKRRGYRVVVPYQREAWCYHDNGYSKMTKYQEYSRKLAAEYQDIKPFLVPTQSEGKKEFDTLKETSRSQLMLLVEKGAKEELLQIFADEHNHGFLHLREFEVFAEIEHRERQAERVCFWQEGASYKQLVEKLRQLRFALKRMEYGVADNPTIAEYLKRHYSYDAVEAVAKIYEINRDNIFREIISRYREDATQFSIIMCTCNSAETLGAAIESVRRQSLFEWELLILDNGSTDKTTELLRQYSEVEPRISCIYRKDNIGWCKGISICLKQATGAYMMFMGADDLLFSEQTLAEVNCEIKKHNPDVVWTGNEYAVLEHGSYKSIDRTVPAYRICERKENWLEQVVGVMQEVYYNSMMHYVKIAFLRKHKIDFFEPFYGDCQGMMEVLCRATRMVIMDKPEYILTLNTSQTAGRVGFDYDMQRQWSSVKPLLDAAGEDKEEYRAYIADRILKNLMDMCVRVLREVPLRNRYMQEVNRDAAERFLRVEEWISSEAVSEMLHYAKETDYRQQVLDAAAELYRKYRDESALISKIKNGSIWLADYVQTIL